METIYLNQDLKSKQAIIEFVKKKLVQLGVNQKYLDTFKQRESEASFNIGNKIAIPHGTYEGSQLLDKSQYVIVHLKNPMFWDDDNVQIIIGLALTNNDQLEMLQNIAINSMNESFFNDLLTSPTIEKLTKLTLEESLWT